MSSRKIWLTLWVICSLSFSTLVVASDLRLVDAAKNGDAEVLRSLLNQHVDVNVSAPDGATPLLWATHREDAATVDLLIHAGANVDAANEYGVSPLGVACSNGNTAIVRRLLQAGAKPNVSTSTGETPLMAAAQIGSLEIVKLLLSAGADVDAKDPLRGQTALMRAVAKQHADVVRMLIERGANVRSYSKGGFTPLLFAAQQGDVAAASILMAAGADVNQAASAQSKRTPPNGALGVNEPEKPDVRSTSITTGLYENRIGGSAPKGENGKDLRPSAVVSHEEVIPSNTTPLLVASASGHEALAKFLLEKGANPNEVDPNGMTALHYALLKGINSINGTQASNRTEAAYMFRSNMLDLVKVLLAHGANPNLPISKYKVGNADRMNLLGSTPLLLAAAAADADAMNLLAAAGANPIEPTKDSTTPLMVAAGMARRNDRTAAEEEKALVAVKRAIELGNDVNAVNVYGMTALHGAALTGANSIIKYLVEMGADVNAKGKIGQVPLSIASGVYPVNIPANEIRFSLNARHDDTAELLLKLGATPLNPEEFSRPGKEGVSQGVTSQR